MHNKLERFIRRVLHAIECAIAVLTMLIILYMLCLEVYRMFTDAAYFSTADNYLHNILTIVVGLEFVRMLVDMTPANTLEVLIVAISRQVIVSHGDPLSNAVCVLCIAGLFAIRRFLIPKAEMTMEMSEVEPVEEPANSR